MRTSILGPRQVRARGTKAWTRDRLARVADWAWPFLEQHLATVLPGERVFRGLDRWMVGHTHRERLRALGSRATDSTMRAITGRYAWRVLAPRSSSSLGSSATATSRWWRRVYGRFKPDAEERDRWERIAKARDTEKWPDRVARDVANERGDGEKLHEESPATLSEREALEDSRGGTRTRDPGIMSAVL